MTSLRVGNPSMSDTNFLEKVKLRIIIDDLTTVVHMKKLALNPVTKAFVEHNIRTLTKLLDGMEAKT